MYHLNILKDIHTIQDSEFIGTKNFFTVREIVRRRDLTNQLFVYLLPLFVSDDNQSKFCGFVSFAAFKSAAASLFGSF